MREIILDTETTGLDPDSGHRVVEIGCIELVNRIATGDKYHTYVNPERDMPTAAFEVHGLSSEFLARHPRFAEVAEDFLAFIGDSPLVIHNAEFDLNFLDAELKRLGRPPLGRDNVVDTLAMARSKFPGSPASLDALCRRFAIDASGGGRHGALLDAELLAEVYLELNGGREPALGLGEAAAEVQTAAEKRPRPSRPHAASEAEIEAHRRFLERSVKDPLWFAS